MEVSDLLGPDGERVTSELVTGPRTEKVRELLLETSIESMYFFGKYVLGMDRFGPLQHELCNFMQATGGYSDWWRAMVCCYRGAYKSSVTTITWPLYMALFGEELAGRFPRWKHLKDGWAGKIIENSSDNAKKNHFLKMVELFRESARADFLQWLMRHRIPKNWRGTNNETLSFIQPSPWKGASISYWGIESKFEGWHGNAVMMDDPEGADAQKSDVPNAEAKAALRAAEPLLEEQENDQIVVVGTPHGNDPLVYDILERERDEQGNVIYDNEQRKSYKVFWIPVLDRAGQPHEPHRFSPAALARIDPEVFDRQFMLRRRARKADIFDAAAIREYQAEWVSPDVVRYKAWQLDINDLDHDGFPRSKLVNCSCQLSEMRRYVHVDPSHRLDEQMRPGSRKDRPSRQAVVVTGVAPDGNVFVLESWIADADLGDLSARAMALFRKWKAYRMTWEAVGAQYWFRDHLLALERSQRSTLGTAIFTGQISKNQAMALGPTISSRMVEAEKTNESKEWIYRERLSPWINRGGLHLSLLRDQELIQAMVNVTSGKQELDLLDAISQGPGIWEPPASSRLKAISKLRQSYINAYVRNRRSNWVNPDDIPSTLGLSRSSALRDLPKPAGL